MLEGKSDLLILFYGTFSEHYIRRISASFRASSNFVIDLSNLRIHLKIGKIFAEYFSRTLFKQNFCNRLFLKFDQHSSDVASTNK